MQRKNKRKFRQTPLSPVKKPKISVKPGPWTNVGTKIKIKARFRPTTSFSTGLGTYIGVYRESDDWEEKGTYPIAFNITAPNLYKYSQTYGLDEILAASERYLSSLTDEDGKSLYGQITILKVLADYSSNQNRQFISCAGKTTKKRIKGFLAAKKNGLKVIK